MHPQGLGLAPAGQRLDPSGGAGAQRDARSSAERRSKRSVERKRGETRKAIEKLDQRDGSERSRLPRIYLECKEMLDIGGCLRCLILLVSEVAVFVELLRPLKSS